MTDINVHIGVRGILDDIVEQLAFALKMSSSLDDIHLISNGEYRASWRRAVVTGDPTEIEAARTSPQTRRLLDHGSSLHVLSNSRIMGDDREIFRNGVLYPRAADRLFNLCSILDSFDVSLRLIVCDVCLMERLNGQPNASPSAYAWSELFERLAEHPTVLNNIHVFPILDLDALPDAYLDILFDPELRPSPGAQSLLSAAVGRLRETASGAGLDPERFLRDMEMSREILGERLLMLPDRR